VSSPAPRGSSSLVRAKGLHTLGRGFNSRLLHTQSRKEGAIHKVAQWLYDTIRRPLMPVVYEPIKVKNFVEPEEEVMVWLAEGGFMPLSVETCSNPCGCVRLRYGPFLVYKDYTGDSDDPFEGRGFN
jgi:hypothetical protein